VAQEAARTFVKSQDSSTRIGIVAFAGFAELVVPPTTDKKQLVQAIDNLTTARGTVIGAATLKAIDALAAVNPDVRPVDATGGTAGGPSAPADPAAPVTKPADGSYVPDIVVLLTDGANTRGIDPIEAAKQAVDRHVRVYTIGFGTTNPTSMVCTSAQLGGEAFDQGFGGGGGFPRDPGGQNAGGGRSFLVIDEPTLTQVAEMTGGTFHKAEDATQLRDVFENLPKQISLQRKDQEVSAVFAAIGAVLGVAAMALSLLWNRYP
jgi:Ca-activated chloride channel family protein